jgi:hypothetical protein
MPSPKAAADRSGQSWVRSRQIGRIRELLERARVLALPLSSPDGWTSQSIIDVTPVMAEEMALRF